MSRDRATKAELVRMVRRLANLIDEWDASMDGDGQEIVDEARALIGEKAIPDGTPGPALLAARFRK